MLAAFATLLFAQIPIGPIKHPGLNPYFHDLCKRVETQLEAGNFEAAKKASLALPNRNLYLEWDDSAIPASRKAEFASARDQAIAHINSELPDTKIRLRKPGDVKISFAEKLPEKDGLPQGAVFFYSPNANEPRVEAVISLFRGNPKLPVEDSDVFNEIGFAVLSYFGRDKTPVSSEFGFRSDLPSRLRRRISNADRIFCRKSMMIVDSLLKNVDSRSKIRRVESQASLDIETFQLGKHVQGEVIPVSFQITNTGTGLLMVYARPDCGCLSIDPSVNIEPGQTALIKGNVDTHEYVGELTKRFLISTNDPNRTYFEIPVHLSVAPIFRTLMPQGLTVMGNAKGATADVFLSLNPAAKFKALSVTTAGLPATATIEPWSGSLADPEFGEGPLPRKGYHVKVSVQKGMPKGRYGITVMITTDSSEFQTIRHSFDVQTGIVALPEQVYFGEIDRSPRLGYLFLSRPGKPFKILSIQGNSSFVTGKVVESKGGSEYKIMVKLDGTQPTGQLGGIVRVKTDDKEQPVIEIPVTGSVR